MGRCGRRAADPRFHAAAALGHARGPAHRGQVFAHGGGGTDDVDLLLCRDQHDDGHGAGACRRHPPALHVLWRVVDDDYHDVRRHHPEHRPRIRPDDLELALAHEFCLQGPDAHANRAALTMRDGASMEPASGTDA